MKDACVFAFLLLIIAAVLGAAYVQPQWATELGLDFWNLPEVCETMHESLQTRAELEELIMETLQRMALRQEIVDELLSNRLTFAEAAGKFKRLNRPTTIPRLLEYAYPGMSPDEACCRNMIDVILKDRRVVSDPDAETRLHRALEQLRADGNGMIQLPD